MSDASRTINYNVLCWCDVGLEFTVVCVSVM